MVWWKQVRTCRRARLQAVEGGLMASCRRKALEAAFIAGTTERGRTVPANGPCREGYGSERSGQSGYIEQVCRSKRACRIRSSPIGWHVFGQWSARLWLAGAFPTLSVAPFPRWTRRVWDYTGPLIPCYYLEMLKLYGLPFPHRFCSSSPRRHERHPVVTIAS